MAFKKGDRVELIDPYYWLPAGTVGTILHVLDSGFVTFRSDGSPRQWSGMGHGRFRLVEMRPANAQIAGDQVAGDQVDYKAEMERAQAKAEAYKTALYASQRMHRAYVHQVSENEALLAAQERSKQASLANASAQQDLDKAMQALEQWS